MYVYIYVYTYLYVYICMSVCAHNNSVCIHLLICKFIPSDAKYLS